MPECQNAKKNILVYYKFVRYAVAKVVAVQWH